MASHEELISGMTDLSAKLAELNDIEKRLAKAKTELSAYEDRLTAVKAELTDIMTGLSAAQRKNQSAHDEEIHRKTMGLADINTRIEVAKGALATHSANARSASARHDQILASIESLRKKFA